MDEDSRLSSPTQQQPSTSAIPTSSSSSDPSSSSSSSSSTVNVAAAVVTVTEHQKEELVKKDDATAAVAAAAQQQQPSTSKTCKDEKREFGYSDTLPFAPWRRKRYGLTVQGLHEEIVDMYHWIKPNDIETRLRAKVYEKVRDSILRKWSHKKIKISMFGSLRTNLFLPTSDIDVLVECDDWVGSNPNDANQEDWLSETAMGLKEDGITDNVTIYSGAFVPIVKMIDSDTQLSIDISFNTVQGVRAASYISNVKDEFPLIEPLVLLLKQFLHYRNLNQTFTGGLSSYGLVLLLVNFFQLYALNMRRRKITDAGVNLGHLLLRFLEVYSLEFNFEEIGISPGQACYIPKAAAGARYGHKRAQPGNLALEDPLLTANDVGRSTYNFSSIANAFGQALQILMVAVTLRERKGRNQLATKVYKGSLLHLIIPFSSKELTYRSWLMSGVLSFPRKDGSASYDLNQLHNTLVSPTVDLSRYGWLRKIPPAPPGGVTVKSAVEDPAKTIRKQVLQQLAAREQPLVPGATSSESSTSTASSTVSSTICPSTTTTSNASDLTMTVPPIPTNTASVNTSATVSTAASISEREDSDSPGLSSSMGTPSSEDDEDGMVRNRTQNQNRRKTSETRSGAPVQFKKPFSEVVAQSGSKRTQTTNGYEEQTTFHRGAGGHHHLHHQQQQQNLHHQNMHPNQQFISYHPHQQQQQPSYHLRPAYLDYASAAAGYAAGFPKPHRYQNHQNRGQRNHSQGSDGSEGYSRSRWPNPPPLPPPPPPPHHHMNFASQNPQYVAMLMGTSIQQTHPQQAPRGRRGPRANSNSSNRSGHSTDSRGSGSRKNSISRGRGRSGMHINMWPAVNLASASSATSSTPTHQDADTTLTEDSGEKNTTLTTDGCRGNDPLVVPRMYADAVKKKSSVGNGMPSGMTMAEASSSRSVPAPQNQPSALTPQPDRSYCSAIKNNLYPKSALLAAPSTSSAAEPSPLPPPPSRKENECGLDTKTIGSSIHHQSDGLRHTTHLGQGIFSNYFSGKSSLAHAV